MIHNIGTVIISSVDDFQFLDILIPQTIIYSKYTSVAIGIKRWDGTPEDVDKITTFIAKHKTKNVLFTMYDPTDEAQHSPMTHNMRKREMVPEAYARHIALQQIPDNINLDYILYLDSDEIIDGQTFLNWLNNGQYKTYDVMKLACYWYWRLPTIRAKDYLEDSIVFMKRKHCLPFVIFHDLARTFFYTAVNGPKDRMITGINGKPMVHHYSWVRTHTQMLRKVMCWGHKNDFESIVDKVNTEFSRNFNGTDFIKGLSYDIVPDKFDIRLYE